MLTRESIEMDFRMALTQADAVDDIAERMSRISNRELSGTLQNLAAGWKGDNAVAYLNKGTLLQNRISSTSGDLRSVASNIRRVAQRIYDAEMEAWEIAQRRDYR